MIREVPHHIESCWTTAHSLRNCDGYQVYEGNAWLGYVDAVLIDTRDDVHSLLVTAGEGFVAVPLEAVTAIDPAAERVELAARGAVRVMSTKEALP